MFVWEICNYYHERSEVLSILQEMVKQFRGIKKKGKEDWLDRLLLLPIVSLGEINIEINILRFKKVKTASHSQYCFIV